MADTSTKAWLPLWPVVLVGIAVLTPYFLWLKKSGLPDYARGGLFGLGVCAILAAHNAMHRRMAG
jgi:hypothetical protein